MANKKTVAAFMHSPVHTIGGEQTLGSAKHELYKLGVHHLPVLQGGKCVGILTDRDIKLAYAVEHESAERLLVKDACVTEVYVVPPDAILADVAKHMADEKIGSAIVMEHGKVTGIFTVTDACRALGEIAR